MNQLSLGITIALRDAFSFRARAVEHSFRSLDNTAFRAARGIQRSIGGIEVGFTRVARTVAAAAAVLTVLIFPTREAMRFHKALSEVSTIADVATTNISRLRETILDQALRFPVGDLTVQTEAVYEAVSAGFLKTADAAHIAEEATKTAVTTLADTQTTLKGIVGLMNSYNMDASQASRVSDLLFQTIRYGVVRMSELAHNIGMVSAAAATSGESIENLLGTYAGMTLGGLSPEQSAQYSRQLYLSIIKPTKGAMQEASKYGITLSKDYFMSKGGLFGTLMDMAEKSKAVKVSRDQAGRILATQIGDPASFFRMLSGRQAAAGASVLLQKAALIQTILKEMAHDEVLDDFGVKVTHRQYALQQRSKELDFQLGRLRSTIQVLAVVMGEATTKVLAPMVRVFTSALEPVVRLVKAYPIIGKLITAQVFAWGAALLWWSVIQLKAIRRSFAFMRVLSRFRREYTMLFGMRVPLASLGKVLAGTVFQLVLGAALIHRAWKKNIGGLGDSVRRATLLFRALTENFRTQYGVWGKMSVELNEQLKKEGIHNSFLLWFAWLTRFKYFGKGLGEGMGNFFDNLAQGITNAVQALGKLLGFATDPAVVAIKSFFKGLNPETNTIHGWRTFGERVGRIAAFILTITMLTKLWTSTLVTARILGWALLAPFKLLKLLFWTGPRAFARNMMSAFRSIRSAALNLWGMLGRLFAFLTRPFRKPVVPPVVAPSGTVGSGTAPAPAGGGVRGRLRDCCTRTLRLLARAVTHLSAIRTALTTGAARGGVMGHAVTPTTAVGTGASRARRRHTRSLGTLRRVPARGRLMAPPVFHPPLMLSTRLSGAPGRSIGTLRRISTPRTRVVADTAINPMPAPVSPVVVAPPMATRAQRRQALRQAVPLAPLTPGMTRRDRRAAMRQARVDAWQGGAFVPPSAPAGRPGFFGRLFGGGRGAARGVARGARRGGGAMRMVGRGAMGVARGVGGAAMMGADLLSGGLASGGLRMFKSLGGAAKGLGGIFRGVGLAFRAMMGPWGIAILVVIGLVVLLVKHWDKVKAAVVGLWTKVRNFFTRAPAWVAMLFGPLGLLIRHFDKVKGVASMVWEGIKSGLAKLKGPFTWLLDKLKAIGRAIGLVGEDPWQAVKDGPVRSDIRAQQQRLGRWTPQLGMQLMERHQQYLRDFIGEYQAGDFERDDAGRAAKGWYLAFARTMARDYAALRQSLPGFEFQVEDEWINRVVQEATGRTPFTVGQVGSGGPGGDGQAAAMEDLADESGEQTDALNDINKNTSRSVALLDALRRGGVSRPWEGQKWPDEVADPYAAFSQRRIEQLAAERSYGQQEGGQVGSKTWEDSLADWRRIIAGLEAKVNELSNITIQTADVVLNGRAIGEVALTAQQRAAREAVERSPNITARPAGVYPASQ